MVWANRECSKFHSLTKPVLFAAGEVTHHSYACLVGLPIHCCYALMLQENFKLLLGCTKQSLIFITCLFILVEKDTANSNPKHPQNACYTLCLAPFSHQTVQSFLTISTHTSAPRQTFPCSSEVQCEIMNRDSKSTLQTIFQLFQINLR